MSLISDLTTLIGKETNLTSSRGKMAKFAYNDEAYTTDDYEGVETYVAGDDQNIPLGNATTLKVNATILTEGYQAQASSIGRNVINHFFGRASYNLNKIHDNFLTFLTSLKNSIGTANGIAVLDNSAKVPTTNLPVGTANGIAGLDGNAKVATSYLHTGEANGVAGLDTNSKVSTTNLPVGTANGIAGLDGNAKIIENQIPDIPASLLPVNEANGVAGLDGNAMVDVDNLPVGEANGIAGLGSDAKVSTTNLPVGTANGVAGLDSSTKVANSNLHIGEANGVAGLDSSTKVANSNLHIGEANGVAGLGSDSKVSTTNLPVGTANGIAGLDSDSKVPTPNLPIGTANGVAGLDSNAKVGVDNLPVGTANGVAGLDANSKVSTTNLPIGTANGVAGLADTGRVPANQATPADLIPISSDDSTNVIDFLRKNIAKQYLGTKWSRVGAGQIARDKSATGCFYKGKKFFVCSEADNNEGELVLIHSINGTISGANTTTVLQNENVYSVEYYRDVYGEEFWLAGTSHGIYISTDASNWEQTDVTTGTFKVMNAVGNEIYAGGNSVLYRGYYNKSPLEPEGAWHWYAITDISDLGTVNDITESYICTSTGLYNKGGSHNKVLSGNFKKCVRIPTLIEWRPKQVPLQGWNPVYSYAYVAITDHDYYYSKDGSNWTSGINPVHSWYYYEMVDIAVAEDVFFLLCRYRTDTTQPYSSNRLLCIDSHDFYRREFLLAIARGTNLIIPRIIRYALGRVLIGTSYGIINFPSDCESIESITERVNNICDVKGLCFGDDTWLACESSDLIYSSSTYELMDYFFPKE